MPCTRTDRYVFQQRRKSSKCEEVQTKITGKKKGKERKGKGRKKKERKGGKRRKGGGASICTDSLEEIEPLLLLDPCSGLSQISAALKLLGPADDDKDILIAVIAERGKEEEQVCAQKGAANPIEGSCHSFPPPLSLLLVLLTWMLFFARGSNSNSPLLPCQINHVLDAVDGTVCPVSELRDSFDADTIKQVGLFEQTEPLKCARARVCVCWGEGKSE